jgi:hypothetical protein
MRRMVLGVSYRCVDCGYSFGDPEDTPFNMFLAAIVHHFCSAYAQTA